MAVVRVGYKSERFGDRIAALLPVDAGKLRGDDSKRNTSDMGLTRDQRDHFENAEYVVTSYGKPIAAYTPGKGWALYDYSTTVTTRRHMNRVREITRARVIL